MSCKQIRVLHIITHMGFGGAQEYTLLSVIGLDAMPEYEVSLLSGIKKGYEGELLSLAREKTHLIMVPEMGRAINPLSDLIALWKIYRLIRKGHYHIVHTHTSKAGVIGRIAAWLGGTPIIVHTLHALVFHDYQPWIVNRTWKLIKKICAPITTYFISVSEIIAEKAIKAGIVKPEKFKTIYSGMELDWFLHANFDNKALRLEFGIPEDALVIGKIARLDPIKGHNFLMNAAPAIVKRFPNVRFLIIGDGVLFEHLQKRAQAYGILENFIFTGLIERKRIPEMISMMDVVVHTSLQEGLARVLPQSLAIGKPCVSFNIDGAPEVVVNNRTGFLVEAGDDSGLIEAILHLLENPDLRRQMGENGRRLVDPAFRTETMVKETAKVYEMLLNLHRKKIEKFNRRCAPDDLD